MSPSNPLLAPGPFCAADIADGDPYELSRGHKVDCLPTGQRGSMANGLSFHAIASDPKVKSAGVDTGFSDAPGMLRAPDVAVGNIEDAEGWAKGAPVLAIEVADGGQNEAQLQLKIEELLAAGTRYLWVLRMNGPRRVEVYERGKERRVVGADGMLEAPEVLQNPVPVRALYEADVAHEVALRNLLQRQGYESLEALREEIAEAARAEGQVEGEVRGWHAGRIEGQLEGEALGQLAGARASLRRVLAKRGLAATVEQELRIDACEELAVLERWHDDAIVATSSAEVFDGS